MISSAYAKMLQDMALQKSLPEHVRQLPPRRFVDWRVVLAFAIGLAFGIIAKGADFEGTAVARPLDAVRMAEFDIKRHLASDAIYQRYVWIPPWLDQKVGGQVDSFVVNTAASRASLIVHPDVARTAPAVGVLLRWDIRRLAANNSNLIELLEVWEKKLAPQERYFNKFVSRDNRNVFIPAEHASHDGHLAFLRKATGSYAPIVRSDWLHVVMLSTLDGGLYYEFAGIKASNDPKVTDQARWLALFGGDEAKSAFVNGDSRAVMFRSNVTGKPRRVDVFHGLSGRSGTGLISITHDTADGPLDAAKHPTRNLLEFTDAAREAIAERPNGLHSFALFDGQGKLQRAAPDNIVADHQIPAPHTRRLQGAISCIRCHAQGEGWQPVSNDLLKMTGDDPGKLNIFADLKDKGDPFQTLDRLAGLYSGDFVNKHLKRGRDDYQEAVLRATQGLGAQEIAEAVAAEYGRYSYDIVTADQAAYELGIHAKAGDGAKALQYLIPPLAADEKGVSPQDPIIGALLADVAVNRTDFEQVYADMADRSHYRAMEFRAKHKGK